MRPETLHPLESLGAIEEVQSTDGPVESAKKRLHRAGSALPTAQRRMLQPGEFRGGQEPATRRILEERETTLRSARREAAQAKEEHRRTVARRWKETESALRQEFRRRVRETADAVARAVEANGRLRDLGRKVEELLPPGEVRSGFLLCDLDWPELNEERYEQWIHFASLVGGVDADAPQEEEGRSDRVGKTRKLRP